MELGKIDLILVGILFFTTIYNILFIFFFYDKGYYFLIQSILFFLIMICLNIFICFILLYFIIIKSIRRKRNIKIKEKNISDYYQYHQLLNPPDMDN